MLNNNLINLQNIFLSLPTEGELERLLRGEKDGFGGNEEGVDEENQSDSASDQEYIGSNLPVNDNFLPPEDDEDESNVTENSDIEEDD